MMSDVGCLVSCVVFVYMSRRLDLENQECTLTVDIYVIAEAYINYHTGKHVQIPFYNTTPSTNVI